MKRLFTLLLLLCAGSLFAAYPSYTDMSNYVAAAFQAGGGRTNINVNTINATSIYSASVSSASFSGNGVLLTNLNADANGLLTNTIPFNYWPSQRWMTNILGAQGPVSVWYGSNMQGSNCWNMLTANSGNNATLLFSGDSADAITNFHGQVVSTETNVTVSDHTYQAVWGCLTYGATNYLYCNGPISGGYTPGYVFLSTSPVGTHNFLKYTNPSGYSIQVWTTNSTYNNQDWCNQGAYRGCVVTNIPFDGLFHLFANGSSNAYERIFHAVSSSPYGPFTNVNVVIDLNTNYYAGVHVLGDPNIFYQSAGAHVMIHTKQPTGLGVFAVSPDLYKWYDIYNWPADIKAKPYVGGDNAWRPNIGISNGVPYMYCDNISDIYYSGTVKGYFDQYTNFMTMSWLDDIAKHAGFGSISAINAPTTNNLASTNYVNTAIYVGAVGYDPSYYTIGQNGVKTIIQNLSFVLPGSMLGGVVGNPSSFSVAGVANIIGAISTSGAITNGGVVWYYCKTNGVPNNITHAPVGSLCSTTNGGLYLCTATNVWTSK